MTTNKDGTKTVISYRFNDDGKRVKTTRRIRTTIVKEKVNPRVAERRAWSKFGNEKGHPPGPSFDTTSVGENIIFRPSITWKKDDKDEQNKKDDPKEKLKNMKVKCRICDGEHFTARCPFKDTMAPMGEGGAAGEEGAGEAGDVDKTGGLGAGSGGYVPPHLRKGANAAAGDKMGGKYERDELATLRVTNVRTTPPCQACVCIEKLTIPRCLSMRKRTSFGGYLKASGESRECSWLRTGSPGERKGSPSLVSLIEMMLHGPVRRLMVVSVSLEPTPVMIFANPTC